MNFDIKKYRKTYYQKNKSAILKRIKQYRIKNKEKVKLWNKTWCVKNKDRYLETCRIYREKNKKARKLYQRHYIRNIKSKAVLYKGGKCYYCGYSKCLGALDFHHVNSKTKDGIISKLTRNWAFLQKELDKCILLCSNCHRELHYRSNLK